MDIQAIAKQHNLSAGDYSRIIAEVNEDPGVKKAQEIVDVYQKRFDSADSILTLPRDERRNRAGDIANDYWKSEAHNVVQIWGPLALVGWLGGGLGLMMAGSAAGIISPQIRGLLALGLLVGTFWSKGFPTLFAAGIKKFILPGRVDKRLKKYYTQERSVAEQKLTSARTTLEQTSLKTMTKLVELEEKERAAKMNANVVELEDEPDYVVIDGVKLKKQGMIIANLSSALTTGW